MKRVAGIAVTLTAAAGLTVSGAMPALAATTPSSFIGGPQINHSKCEVGLLIARLSSKTPADVAAEVYSTDPGHTCTAWVERSATKGTTNWSVASAKVAVPSVSGLEGIANTGLVYDGPGYKARACVRAGSAAAACTSVVSLAKGAGTATSPAFGPVYASSRNVAFAFGDNPSDPGLCAGVLAGSTTVKKTGTTVLGLFDSEAVHCTGWIQSSANKGKTWTTVSPVVSFTSPNPKTDVLAFTAHYADGPGHLARLCVKDMTSKQVSCSSSW